MISKLKNLPLSVQIIGSVALVLLAIGAANTAFEIRGENREIAANAEKRGIAALDMLESVHVNAMVNRDQTADGDPAIATLDGTMEQFSKQNHGVELWLVMAPKVIDFQKASGETDVEGPRDQIDEKTMADKQAQVTVAGDKMRITRPVILGQGTAADARCAACHTGKMGIAAGEMVGVYSAAVDLAPDYAQAQAEVGEKLLYAAIMLILALAIVSWLLRATAIKPLRALAGVTKSLASGNIDVASGASVRKDEIGDMARALDVFRDAVVQNRRLEADAETNRIHAEADRARAQEQAEQEAAARLKVATSGLAAGLHRLADGDLAFQLTEPFAPEFEELRHDFNASLKQLGDTLAVIRTSVSAIDDGTREIAAGTDDLSRRTEQQAASLEETAAAVAQITANVSNSTILTAEARSVATTANADAAKSEVIVADAENAMQRIEDSSKKIANIIGVIDEIAFQTNLLALNAGVEAARAGDAGKGFAVVAQEVRELAQRSANAAKEIKALIESSSNEVGNGVRLVRDAGTALKSIGTYIGTINTHMVSISASGQDQATGLAEVNTAVNSMDQMTQQNAAMVEQSNAASAMLAGEAAKLRGLVAQFKLSATQNSVQALRQTARTMAQPAARPTVRMEPQRPRIAAQASGGAQAQGNWEEF